VHFQQDHLHIVHETGFVVNVYLEAIDEIWIIQRVAMGEMYSAPPLLYRIFGGDQNVSEKGILNRPEMPALIVEYSMVQIIKKISTIMTPCEDTELISMF
jgi:hypothetical protein